MQVGKLDLVLFDEALSHAARISRVISMPRGSMLLVGVGGSGKRSLTRLAAHMACHTYVTIQLSKSYSQANLLEDIKQMFLLAGFRKPVTFVFTDKEMKDEIFLETISMVLSTGDIPGLLQKDEVESVIGELSSVYEKTTGKDATRAEVRSSLIAPVVDAASGA